MKNLQKSLLMAMTILFTVGISNLNAQENSKVGDSDETLVFVFAFKVKPENEAAYQKMLGETFAITKNEPGTLMYEVYKDENGVYCQYERYTSEAACWTHLQNTAKQTQQWLELTEMQQIITMGQASAKLREQFQLKEVYTPFKKVEK